MFLHVKGDRVSGEEGNGDTKTEFVTEMNTTVGASSEFSPLHARPSRKKCESKRLR